MPRRTEFCVPHWNPRSISAGAVLARKLLGRVTLGFWLMFLPRYLRRNAGGECRTPATSAGISPVRDRRRWAGPVARPGAPGDLSEDRGLCRRLHRGALTGTQG